jgi:glutamate synthase (ferredoxin)
MNGQANDYVGKSMNGGTLIVKPAEEFSGSSAENVIIGNTCLYGANGGLAFFSGRGGERFAVRNSGVHAVVEGVGDHACEYMTGGRVVCLGGVGRNMGAGMTGGLAYVLPNPKCNEFECDLSDIDFLKRTSDDIRVQRLKTDAAKDELKDLIKAHYEATGSETAKEVLENWEATVRLFWQVIPPSEDNSVFTTPGEQLAMMAPQKITGEQPVSRDGTTEMGGSEKEVILAGGSIDEDFMDKQFK